jgi:hypothetical protein
MALVRNQHNYHSISDFRKQNPSGLKNLFKLFVSFPPCGLDWVKLIADDGKQKYHNSKKIILIKKKMFNILKSEPRISSWIGQNDLQDNSITTKIAEKNRAIKKANRLWTSRRKIKKPVTDKYHRSRWEPFSSRSSIEISYNIKQQWIISII